MFRAGELIVHENVHSSVDPDFRTGAGVCSAPSSDQLVAVAVVGAEKENVSVSVREFVMIGFVGSIGSPDGLASWRLVALRPTACPAAVSVWTSLTVGVLPLAVQLTVTAMRLRSSGCV